MEVLGDTWAWDGAQWTQVSTQGPPARFPGGLIYDSARQEVLLYSGHFAESTGEFIGYDDLWAWDGTSWREISQNQPTPGHRTHSAMVFDPNTESVLLISSGSQTFLSDLWAWDGTQWQSLKRTILLRAVVIMLPTTLRAIRSSCSAAWTVLGKKH